MPSPSPSHQVLISSLYTGHQGWLHNWLRRKLGCSQRAADLVQDTFVRLLTLPDPAQVQEPRAFLTTTAMRLLIDGERRRKLERTYLAALAQQSEELAAAGPEAIHQALTVLEDIALLLDGLPERPRRAFLLSRLDGLGHAEIAEQLGVSKSMVRQYIAQVLVHCYGLLHGEGAKP